jgi:hypothetical protein
LGFSHTLAPRCRHRLSKVLIAPLQLRTPVTGWRPTCAILPLPGRGTSLSWATQTQVRSKIFVICCSKISGLV